LRQEPIQIKNDRRHKKRGYASTLRSMLLNGNICSTKTHHEKAYDQLPVDERLTTRVRLTLKDGSTRERLVAHPRGTGDRVLTNADIVVKYRSLTRSVIPPERQTAIEKTVLNLDTLGDISELAALLIPTVRSAFD
jgi:aconitate decarboxylase